MSGCPVGMIVMWGGVNNVPAGWLLCDGSIHDQTTYPALYNVIGHNFGVMSPSPDYDPSTQFYVPDFRGRFIRGVDGGSHRDPDSAERKDMQSGEKVGGLVGSVQADEFKIHRHGYDHFPGGDGNIASGDYWEARRSETEPSGGRETRPVNAYAYFIIKALKDL